MDKPKFTGYFNYLKNDVLKTNYFSQLLWEQVAEKEKWLKMLGHDFRGGIIVNQLAEQRNRIFSTTAI